MKFKHLQVLLPLSGADFCIGRQLLASYRQRCTYSVDQAWTAALLFAYSCIKKVLWVFLQQFDDNLADL